MKPQYTKILYTASAIVLSVALTTYGQGSLRARLFNLDNGVAIQGYDPVSYIAEGKAVKGKREIALNQEGVTYLFSSEANKELFAKNGAAYEPQYGGWCAYAMGASGEKVEVDPETFKVVDGKLYLFYNSFFNNTLPKWNKAESDLKAKADKNWMTLFK